MLCYILAQYAPQVHENILLFFRHKKQSHRNCCRILNINLVIGICSSNFSKLQMLPTPGYVSANPISASCRCFRPRPGICKSNSSKLQMLPRPEFTPICICKSNFSKLQMLPTPTRHLQLQFQQVADDSKPDQASANPIPTSCRCFRP